MQTQQELFSPRLGNSSSKDSPSTSKDISFDDIGVLNLAPLYPPSKSLPKSHNSSRSKYTSNSKLIQSDLFKCLKNYKTSRQWQRQEERSIQMGLLGQSLWILERQRKEIELEMRGVLRQLGRECLRLTSRLQDSI